jgi:hypothetical protein
MEKKSVPTLMQRQIFSQLVANVVLKYYNLNCHTNIIILNVRGWIWILSPESVKEECGDDPHIYKRHY